jgi:hypothetical protein
MHPAAVRAEAIRLLAEGVNRAEVSRRLGVSRNSTKRWQERIEPLARAGEASCFRCVGNDPDPVYTYLLGQYLGDGHIARSGRSTALRIYCTTAYPKIIREVAEAHTRVMGTKVHYRVLTGCTAVCSTTVHWKCVFPQHGPGMKHTRKIALTDWQQVLVERNPHGLIRGLIHSDGCRATNSVQRMLPAGPRRYSYTRYFFSNVSTDIRTIFTDSLDLLGIAWKQNRWNSISIARREAVAALDEFVGPKA